MTDTTLTRGVIKRAVPGFFQDFPKFFRGRLSEMVKGNGMTEQEWLSCTDPNALLNFLLGKASDRKLRLFACACCRRIWHLLSDKGSRKAVVVSEQYADGLVTDIELGKAGHAAWVAACKSSTRGTVRGERNLRYWTWQAVLTAQYENIKLRNYIFGVVTAVLKALNDERCFDPCLVLRDIFGCVFYSATVNDSWLAWNDRTVVKLAEAIYHDRVFDRLPILADALEEAGCDSADILTHCRQPGEHVRGCWVVDLLLNKS